MDEVLVWVQEVNRKGEELDDLCSTTHPTAWHEDPDIVEAKNEWKEVAGGEAKPSRYKCVVCKVGIKHRDIMVTCGAGTYIGRCCSDEWSFGGDHEPVRVRRGPTGSIMGVVQNGLLEDVQPKVGKSRRVVATQLTLFNSRLVFGETPARAWPQATLPEGAPLRLCTQDTDGKPREGHNGKETT